MPNNNHTDVYEHDYEGEASSGERLDFQHHLRTLRKNKWPITLFTALVTTLAAYYAYTATPVYASESTLLIESQKLNAVSVKELYGVEKENSDYYQTQYEILRSRALATRVVKRLQRDGSLQSVSESSAATVTPSTLESGTEAQGPLASAKGLIESVRDRLGLTVEKATMTAPTATVELTPAVSSEATAIDSAPTNGEFGYSFDESEINTSPELRQTVSQFRSGLSINPVRKTKLVNIRYASTDPEYAALVANVVAEEYILSVLDARMSMKEKASSWMNERVAVLKAKLDESEQRLIKFKQDNGLVDVNGSVGRLNEQELLLATTELAQAKSQLSDAQDLFREVTSLQRSAPELLETLPAIQNDALVRSVKIDFGQQQREFDELSNRYGSRHPKIIDAQSRLDSLRSTLDGHIARVVGSIQKDYQLRRQRVSAIQASLNKGKENIQIIGEKKFKLDGLEREVTTNRDIYNHFFSRITETASSDGLEAANAVISDYAVPSGRPFKPKKQMIIALAALVSFVISVLMALLYEQMDDTIKGTHDVESKLGVRLLGILPLVNKSLLGAKRSLPLNPSEIVDKKGTFVESVNTARTALSMNGVDRKIILVTSSVPGEGKSTTAMNLAYSFSQLERVLLIDCDMRRPSLAKAIGLTKNAEGLSNLITRSAAAKDCIRRGAIGTLDILLSGPMPQQPLELLSSNRFEKIIDQLKLHYDKIIIDSAPTQAVSDALVLSKLADAVVYVVKSHDTSMTLVDRGLARLSQVDANIAGVLMTQVDIEKIAAYGGDYYYQGYYDYYGYTDKGGSKKGKSGKITLSPEELGQIKLDDEDVELDLGNFVRSAAATQRVASRDNVETNRDNVETNRDNVETNDEFDLTRQVSGLKEPSRRETVSMQSRATKDDLDLI